MAKMLQAILKSRFFYVTAAIITVVSFVALLNLKKNYQAEIDVLILPKNNQVASDIEQIMATAQRLPLTLSFYDKIISRNPKIQNSSEGLEDYERKNIWNSKIETERTNKSEIIKIRVFDENPRQAEIIATQTAEELAQTLAFYYDIRTELDVRVVDGPIVKKSIKNNWVDIAALSLLAGILAGLLNFGIVSFIPEKRIDSKRETTDFTLPGLDEFTQRESKKETKFEHPFVPESPAEKPKEKTFEKTDISRETVYTKKAPAPDNLPIASEKTDSSNGKITPEEAKEKLNKLLRGEL